MKKPYFYVQAGLLKPTISCHKADNKAYRVLFFSCLAIISHILNNFKGLPWGANLVRVAGISYTATHFAKTFMSRFARTCFFVIVSCVLCQFSVVAAQDATARPPTPRTDNNFTVLHLSMSPNDQYIKKEVEAVLNSLRDSKLEVRTLSASDYGPEAFYEKVAKLSLGASFVVIEGHAHYIYRRMEGNPSYTLMFINSNPDTNKDLVRLTQAADEERFKANQHLLYDPNKIFENLPPGVPIYIDSCNAAALAKDGKNNIATACEDKELSYGGNPITWFMIDFLKKLPNSCEDVRAFDTNGDGKITGKEWYAVIPNTRLTIKQYSRPVKYENEEYDVLQLEEIIEHERKLDPDVKFLGVEIGQNAPSVDLKSGGYLVGLSTAKVTYTDDVLQELKDYLKNKGREYDVLFAKIQNTIGKRDLKKLEELCAELKSMVRLPLYLPNESEGYAKLLTSFECVVTPGEQRAEAIFSTEVPLTEWEYKRKMYKQTPYFINFRLQLPPCDNQLGGK